MAKDLMHKGKQLKNRKTKKYSKLIATIERVNTSGNKSITIQFCADHLPKMDGVFGKADPYFLIQRAREDIDGKSKWIKVYGNRKNHIKKTLNPKWNSFTIESQTLCNNDYYRPIQILLYDWDSDGNDDYIGKINTTLDEIRSKPKNLKITLYPKLKFKRTPPTFSVLQFEEKPLDSFLDYIQGNVDIGLMFAIDFTGSNRPPKDPQSLHYVGNYQPSEYQNAIREIGNIVSVYDTDQKYPVWGNVV